MVGCPRKGLDECQVDSDKQPSVKIYNPTETCKVSADASKDGIGAVLPQQQTNQVWAPVAYASRSMTSAETHYAHIEKECLALTFACERFHQFLFGQKVLAETDHKPLISIFKKPLSDSPLRLQRMRIRLQKYDLSLTYTPGKELWAADAMSRAVDKTTAAEEDQRLENYVEAYIRMVITSLPVAQSQMQNIKAATQGDETLLQFRKTIRERWPDKRTQCPSSIVEFWNYRDELDKQKTEPLQQHKLTTRPWEKVGADLFEVDGKDYIAVVDYSQYVEIATLPSTTSKNVINSIRSIFACHGTAIELISDNGPQFASKEFKNFATMWNFKHTTSSPHHPASNGQAENAVKIVKTMIRKVKDSGEDLHLALQVYRSTPLEHGVSPAELLFNRKIKSNLSIKHTLLNPKLGGKQTQIIKKKLKQQQKRNFDEISTPMAPLHVGDTVRVQNIHHGQGQA
ncbi:uncharacterized protein K02A2.6-like [Anneissia japonica]|uniref:uncharacterized protein K02A2.6-like n=1 Tax=Anneissia japonica TaxID=1529436 RepID=UPI00142593BF|nr:uncharacterized protein K02A2.6-like [Anneissia japonica]